MNSPRITGPALIGFAGVALLAACAAAPSPTRTSVVTAAPATTTATPILAATPPPAAAPTPIPSGTPIAYGPAVVVHGRASCDATWGTTTTGADGTSHMRGGVVECIHTSNDDRVSGNETSSFNGDGWANAAMVLFGASRITNEGGSWEGTYSGANSDSTGDIVLWWFKGTGGYAGLSYVMWEHLSPAEVAWSYPVEGMIFPGEPPTP
jgi:hypothetical protein